MTDSSSQSSNKPFSRLYHRLSVARNSRQFYESHQLYRTLFNRLSTVNPAEAERVLEEGAQFLLQNNQSESGADLVVTLLRFYGSIKRPPTKEIVLRLKNHIGRMARQSSERKSVLMQALQWLGVAGDAQLTDLFNNWMALILWKEENYAEARYHMLLSGNGAHTAMLLLWAHLGRGYRSERDLFVTQAVLQLLCLERAASASAAFCVYVRHHPDLQGHGPPFPGSPLLNFAWFLMAAIELRLSGAAFTVLCDRYERHLGRDPLYRDYLARIGHLYFHIGPVSGAASQGGGGGGRSGAAAAAVAKGNDNLISNIMNMLIGGGPNGATAAAGLGDDGAETSFTSEEMD